MSIREDERQWLIYQEGPVVDTVALLEAFLMSLGSASLINHEDQEVRAVGNVGQRIAETRIAHWLGQLENLPPTERQKELAHGAIALARYMGGAGDKPEQFLDEVHAVAVWIDKRSREAGVAGPGWYREIVRDSTWAKEG